MMILHYFNEFFWTFCNCAIWVISGLVGGERERRLGGEEMAFTSPAGPKAEGRRRTSLKGKAKARDDTVLSLAAASGLIGSLPTLHAHRAAEETASVWTRATQGAQAGSTDIFTNGWMEITF